MKIFLMATAATVVLGLGAAQADPVHGMWQTVKDDNGNYGFIDVKSSDGGGAYSGGKVYSPDRDKTYRSKMILKGNNLNIKGCILGICRDGGSWTRVD